MKRLFQKIWIRIIPELLYLFKIAIPIALIIMWLFVFLPIFAQNTAISIDDSNVLLYGFLLSILGVYISRLVAWAIWKIFIRQYDLIPDIYDATKNDSLN